MTYIPVGTILTYTAQVDVYLTHGYNNWENLVAQLRNDLPNLQGMEQLLVSNSSGNSSILDPLHFSVSLEIVNNGIDHGSELDIQSIIDGTIQGYGNGIRGSNITKIKLPDNPDDGSPQVIDTGVTSNAPPPSTPNSSPSIFSGFKGFSLSGGSIAGISITVIIVVLIIAVLLLPKNARRLVGG